MKKRSWTMMLAATAVAALALAAAGCGDDTVTCTGGQTSCNGICTDTAKDPQNCGSCGTKCDTSKGETCNAGKCEGCPAPKVACNGSCIDVQSDNNNCGACGTKCDTAAGLNCVAGACTCVGGLTACGTPPKCVALTSDPLNCGACGTACPAGESCQNGKCGDCPAPKLSCSGACIDPQSDNNNCGACGTKCDTAAGFNCVSGKCSCIGGLTDCSGKCVNTSTDGNNCGTCGNACPATQTCQGGTCTGTPCTAPNKLCNGACINVGSDNDNCGDCGIKCTGGKTCIGGACTCPSGQTDCSGTCKNTTNDPTACGNCTTTCPASTPLCINSKCEGKCGTGQTDCAGVCVNLTNDNNNCGTCGVKCTGGMTCQNSVCSCPSSLPNVCSGTCYNFQTDEQHCGSCTKVCAANETCSAGVCTASPVIAVAVTCAQTSLPVGGKTQCTATGTLQSGATLDLTADPKLTWSDVTSGTCAAGDPGSIDCDPDGSGPIPATKGLYCATDTAAMATCKSNISATYQGATTTIASNVVTITSTAKTLLSIYVTPTTPTVPYLVGANACAAGANQTLTIQFKVIGKYDSGQDLELTGGTKQWVSTNAAVASINSSTGLATLGTQTSPPTANLTTTIQVNYTDGTYSSSVSTLLTVVPGTLTSLAISPTTDTIPLGAACGTAVKTGFTVTASFGTSTFNVTDLTNAGSPYAGWSAAGIVAQTAATYLNDCGINSSTHKHEFFGVAQVPNTTKTTPETVTATFCGEGGSTKNATAQITVTGATLVSCSITSGGGTYTKGQTDVPFVATGTYSDNTTADITAQVAWSSTAPTIAFVDNSAGNKGEVDMLLAGTAKIEADPAAIKTGVAKCSADVTVVDGIVCSVAVQPVYRAAEGRRLYKGTGTNGPGYAADKRPLLPNETGFSQRYRAMATVYPATCGTGTAITVDATANATWSVAPATVGKPAALQYAGTAGLFNVVPNAVAGNENRVDIVKAEVSETPGSATKIAGLLDTAVCGTRVLGTLRVNDAFSETTDTANTTTTTYAGDTSKRFYLRQQFKDQTTAAVACGFPSPSPLPLTADGYLLDITEDATAWTSTDDTKASVSGVANTRGNITAKAAGNVLIGGSFGGTSSSLLFTVSSALIKSCAITPVTASLVFGSGVGSSQQFAATATLTDNTPKNITADVSWVAVTSAIADFNTSVDGLLVAKAVGSTDIRASIATGVLGGGTLYCTPCNVAGETECLATATPPKATVTAATVTGYFIQTADRTCLDAPAADVTISIGTGTDLYGCIQFSNGAVQAIDLASGDDPSGLASWIPGTGSVATVDNNGYATAAAAGGPITVTSYYAGLNDTISVTVSPSAVTGLKLGGINVGAAASTCATESGAAGNACELEGTTVQLQIIGVRANSSTQDLTSMSGAAFNGCWNSTTCAVANCPGYFSITSKGFATITATGSATPVEVTLCASAAGVTANTLGKVRIYSTDPNGLSVTASPAALTGAGKISRLTSIATVPLAVGSISINVTNDTDFTHAVTGGNPAAIYIYEAAGQSTRINGYVLSKAVTAASTAVVTGTYNNSVATGQSSNATLTINP